MFQLLNPPFEPGINLVELQNAGVAFDNFALVTSDLFLNLSCEIHFKTESD